MEVPLDSIFNYQQEGVKELKQMLLNTTVELENLRNVNAELINLLNMAYQERDEAKDQLQKAVNKLMIMPSTTSNELKNPSFEVYPETLVMVPTTKANSSITESNSLSHVSSPIDAVSSPELSNVNVIVDSSHYNFGYPVLNQNHNQSQSQNSDSGTAVIDFLAKGKALPQKGRLLQAVMDAGPLLQNLILAGPLPTWRNPPPLKEIKVLPPFAVKDFDSSAGIVDLGGSNSVLNFGAGGGGCNSGSWNNATSLTSNNATNIRNYLSSRNRQRGQIL